MRRSGSRRDGATFAGVVIIVAGFGLLLAAAMPTLRARSFNALVDQAAGEISTLRAASEQHFASTSQWPTPGDFGEIPPEVATAFPGRTSLTHDEYSLRWRVLEMLEQRDEDPESNPIPADADATPDSVGPNQVSVPIGIGGIVLRSGDDELLAELLARYGAQASFVRDSTLTLVVGVTPGS